MDQRPQDPAPKTDWDRLPRGDDGSWSLVPVLLVVALLAVGAWLLFANSGSTPTTTTSESTPSTAPSPKPTPPSPPAATPTTPPPSNSAPAPATKP
jgi:cytoskeletal protein RodZ